ncbi:translation protein SH3-like domain-containing protein [Scheffersomyces coipomensis]|uniref:translation protein SH3-like domain-containing protein n=1 Tax=Scheffersomyces coipomensis TaxID=1788519 RepID=UPI00315C716A
MLGIISTGRLLVRPRIVPTIQSITRSFKTLRTELPTVYNPLPKKRNGAPVLPFLQSQLLDKYDPSGKRRELQNTLRAGDIIKVTYLDRTDVVGRIIAIKRGNFNVGTNILIRNKINKVGCEVRVPLYSPKLRNVEVLHKPKTYLPRGKQYYIRNTRLDVDDVEAFVKRHEVKVTKALKRRADVKAEKKASRAAKRAALEAKKEN